MKKRVWELSLEERRKRQDGPVREMLIGAYAPCEPQVMDMVMHFLRMEKKLPLNLAHKVMDRLAKMTICTTVVTHDEIVDFIRGIPEEFAVVKGPCACRINTAEELGPDARDLCSENLEFCRQSPLNVDIQIATCGEKFGKLPSYAPISKAELLELEEECFTMGLVANIYVLMGGDAGICHCSSATCAPFLANEAIGYKSKVVLRGKFVATTNTAKCEACGRCLQACHFNARRIVSEGGMEHSALISSERCYGCGLCVHVCRTNALDMTPRSGIGGGNRAMGK